MSEEKKVAIPEAPVKQAVETMSHRQLRAELQRSAGRKYEGKGFVMGGVDFGDTKKKNNAGLENALATVLLTVLDNTKTSKVFEFKENGQPKRFARKDQIGPGTLSCYLR